MQVQCHKDIFQRFPTASIHGVVFEQLNLFDERKAEKYRSKAEQSIRERQNQPEMLLENPTIKEWREAYKNFGLKPSKFRSSIEQLYRRAMKGDVVKTGIPLVDAYCYVSLIEMAPMGGYDLSKTQGDIVMRYTISGETFTPIGSKEPMTTDAGIVAYVDEQGVICWGWNHRDSVRTCLDEGSEAAIFFADSSTEDSRQQAERAINLLRDAFASAGCIEKSRFVLDQHNHEAIV